MCPACRVWWLQRAFLSAAPEEGAALTETCGHCGGIGLTAGTEWLNLVPKTNWCQWQGQEEDYVAGTAQRGILSSLALAVLVASIHAQPARLLLSLPGISAKGREGAEGAHKLQPPYFLYIKFLVLTAWMIFLNTVYASIQIHYLFPQHHMGWFVIFSWE